MRLQFECSDVKNYTKSLKSNNELEPLAEDLEIAYMHAHRTLGYFGCMILHCPAADYINHLSVYMLQ